MSISIISAVNNKTTRQMKLYSKEMPPDQSAEINEQLCLAFIALNRIPTIAKRIFLLRLFGDTYEEIGNKTNRSRERCRQVEMKVRRYLTAVFSAAENPFFDNQFFPKWNHLVKNNTTDETI